jgi:hypothetical protein
MGNDRFADRQRAGAGRVTPDSPAPAKARGVTQNRWQQAGLTATQGDWQPANPAGRVTRRDVTRHNAACDLLRHAGRALIRRTGGGHVLNRPAPRQNESR